MIKYICSIKDCLKRCKNNRPKYEYHKKLLNLIIINSIGMMWCSYILAWFGRGDIAESLSQTIATTVIGVTIPYLVTKTIENISKYGSRLNNTSVSDDNN